MRGRKPAELAGSGTKALYQDPFKGVLLDLWQVQKEEVLLLRRETE